MTHLHRTLQTLYAGDDGAVEMIMDGYRVDVVRDGVIYEIQTGRFRAMRAKLETLSLRWPVVIVHPVAAEKLLTKIDPATGEVVDERRSPKRGDLLQVFIELPGLGPLLRRENVHLEVLLCREREVRDVHGRPHKWRRRTLAKMLDRQLVEVLARHLVSDPLELLDLLPAPLPDPYTVPDLELALGIKTDLARKVAYGLVQAGVSEVAGRRSRHPLYRRASGPAERPTPDSPNPTTKPL